MSLRVSFCCIYSGLSSICSATERTARERWKLFKNVSKLGLQRSISISSETGGGNNSELDANCLDGSISMSFNNMLNNAVEEDEEDDDLPAVSVPKSVLQELKKQNL